MIGIFKNIRRRRIISAPWQDHWTQILEHNIRLSRTLGDSELQKLCVCIKVFCGEKDWEGCDGLTLTDKIRVTIAANACLMLLGVENFWFDNVKTILIFPEAFDREAKHGLLAGGREHRSGEAWQGGPIVLSWRDALRDSRHANGRNVVIHEFAHALDGLDGEMGGSPTFSDNETAQAWERVVDREFNALREARQRGVPTLLDHYGATSRAEFFAVASETFFEQPHELAAHHYELFDLLRTYYRVDPAPWQ